MNLGFSETLPTAAQERQQQHTTEFRPIEVNAGGGDHYGALALVRGQLVAIFVRLDDEVHGPLLGRWHLEAFFGGRAVLGVEPFEDLEAAGRWVTDQLPALSMKDVTRGWQSEATSA